MKISARGRSRIAFIINILNKKYGLTWFKECVLSLTGTKFSTSSWLMWNSVDFIFSYLGRFAIPIFVLDFGFEWTQN